MMVDSESRAWRLFAIAVTSTLVCYAAARAASEPEALARELFEKSGVTGGLVVHVGCGNGRLTAAFRAGESYIVHGLARDRAQVDEARRYAASRGLHGPVSIARWGGNGLPYPENFVNLLVVDGGVELRRREIMRALAPRGVACIRQGDQWRWLEKSWPERMDEWTHWSYDASGNAVSHDAQVAPPREMQWVAGPSWSKSHNRAEPAFSVLVTAGGRTYYVDDEVPTSLYNVEAKWHLKARDAFNGTFLWQRPLEPWVVRTWFLRGNNGHALTRLVAVGDRVYVPLGKDQPVSALDGATGEVIRTYDDGPAAEEIIHRDGVLVVAGKDEVVGLAPGTGKRLWRRTAEATHLAAWGGGVFFVDRTGGMDRASMVCVDLHSGRERWASRPLRELLAEAGNEQAADGTFRISWRYPLRVSDGVALVRCDRPWGIYMAFDTDDGEFLWHQRSDQSTWIANGLVWMTHFGGGLMKGHNPRTLEVEREVHCPQMKVMGHHVRCYPGKATDRFMLGNERGVEFVDFETGDVWLHNWVRATCWQGMMPANGMVYATPHSCRCYTEVMIRGFYALAPRRSVGHPLDLDATPAPRRLEHGPAYGEVHGPRRPREHAAEWPTHRHDALRSGATDAPVPQGLAVRWKARMEARPGALSIARGKVFVPVPGASALRALDAETGETVWRFVTGGPIDSPPTVYGNGLIFGSADGSVYCLRADDGELAWRFQAAPLQRWVGVKGRLESAWPVHGSVLVQDGVAYFTAGRSSFLDGGIHLYGLDALTGKPLYQHRLDGPWPGPEVGTSKETPNPGYVVPGALSDVMVGDGEHVYLRHLRFEPQLNNKVDLKPHYYPAPELTGQEEGGDQKYWDNLLNAPRHATFHNPDYYNRSYYNNWPGKRLYATEGLLDDSWHKRSYWSYGQIVGQYLVFRGDVGYAVKAYPSASRNGGVNAGAGYLFYAGRTDEPAGDEKLYALDVRKARWQNRLPLRAKAMLLAGDRLYAAGVPDSADPAGALAALEGQKGGLLYVLSVSDGKKLQEYRLDSPPVFEGMAAARGRLFIATRAGEVVCLAAAQ